MILILNFLIFPLLMVMSLPHPPMVYIFHSLVCFHVSVFNNRTQFLTAKLLNQGYRYHKLPKVFSKFYRIHSELIVKYNIGLKNSSATGIFEPVFYADFSVQLSSFSIIFSRKRGWLLFILIAFSMSCDCFCSVALHHGAIGRSTVCD